jgi:hypothetical protein
MQTPENGTKAQSPSAVRRRLAALKTLRDEVRVDLNLANKEVREQWHRIEAKLRVGESRVRSSTGFRSLKALSECVKRYRASLRREPRA